LAKLIYLLLDSFQVKDINLIVTLLDENLVGCLKLLLYLIDCEPQVTVSSKIQTLNSSEKYKLMTVSDSFRVILIPSGYFRDS